MRRDIFRDSSLFGYFNTKRRFTLLSLNNKTKTTIARNLALRDSKYKIGDIVRFRKSYYKIGRISIENITYDLLSIRKERYVKKGEVRYCRRSATDLKYQTDGKYAYKTKEIHQDLFKKFLCQMDLSTQLFYVSGGEIFTVNVDINEKNALKITNYKTNVKKSFVPTKTNIEKLCSNIEKFGQTVGYIKYV